MVEAYEVVEKYYSKLISLPRTPVIICSIISVTLLFSLTFRRFEWISRPEVFLETYLAYLASVMLLVLVLKGVMRNRHITLRRIAGVVLVALLIYSPVEVIGTYKGVPGLGMASSAGFVLFILTALKTLYLAILATVVGIGSALITLSLLLFATKIHSFNYIYHIAAGLSSSALFSLLVLYIKRVGKKYRLDPLNFARGFINVWIGGSEEYLEREFARISRYKDLHIDVIKFCRIGKRPIVLVIPTVHFGPFRNIGSSALPYFIDREASSKGMHSMVLHSAGSHEHNMVHSKDSQELAKYIIEKALGVECYEELANPFRVHEDKFQAFAIPTSRRLMILITNPEEGSDDLPPSLIDIAKRLENSSNYSTITLVDAHNVKGERPRRIEILEKLILRSLSTITPVCRSSRVGFAEVEVKGHVVGLCYNKLKLLLIECDDSEYALVYAYGNNAEPKVRRDVLKELHYAGIKDGEFITPDDHTCAASAMDKPYHVIHSSEAIVSAVREALKLARRDLAPSRVGFRRLNVKLEVMDDSVWKLIALLEAVGSSLMRLLPLVVVTSILVPCVLPLL